MGVPGRTSPQVPQTPPPPVHRACAQELVPLLARGDLADCSRIITHRLPLSRGPEAYQLFEARAEGWVKVVLEPWA